MQNLVPKQKLFSLIVMSFCVFGATSTQAETVVPTHKQTLVNGTCQNYLQLAQYGIHDAFLQKTKPSFTPEPGSIEDRNPGLIAELLIIREGILVLETDFVPTLETDLYENPYYLQLLLKIQILEQRLEDLVQKHKQDPRIAKITKQSFHFLNLFIDSFNNHHHPSTGELKARFKHITSNLWEVIVACAIAGDQIYLNHTVSQLLPTEFSKLMLKHRRRSMLNREIDIAVKRPDGSWRWIEVKDWGHKSATNHGSQAALMHQSRKQNEARLLFPQHKIQLDLFLKYGIGQEEYQDFLKRSQFDNIYFIFPDGAVLKPRNPN